MAVVTLTKHFVATGEKNGKPWTRHDFKDAENNKYSTFVGTLAEGLKQNLNTPVELLYDSSESNGYVNNTIQGWAPVEGSSPVNAAPASPAQAPAPSQDEFRRSKEEMRRTEAVKAAATLIASPNWQGETDIETLGVLADEISALIEHGAPVF